MVDQDNPEVVGETSEETMDLPETEETVSEIDQSSETQSTETTEGGRPTNFDGDITKLPQELQQIAKGFQADYTRQKQELVSVAKSLQSHQHTLDLLTRAEQGDPEAIAQLQRRIPAPRTNQEEIPPSPPAEFKTTKDLADYINRTATHIAQKMVEGKMNSFVNQNLTPMLQPFQQFMIQQEINNVATTWGEAFHAKRFEIADVMDQRKVDLRTATELVLGKPPSKKQTKTVIPPGKSNPQKMAPASNGKRYKSLNECCKDLKI